MLAVGCGAMDIVLGVDVSGSVRRERLPHVLSFMSSLVDDLEIGADKARVALVYFSDNAYQLFDFDRFSSKEDIEYWIKQTPYLGGRTNSAAALRLMVGHIISRTFVYYTKSQHQSVELSSWVVRGSEAFEKCRRWHKPRSV